MEQVQTQLTYKQKCQALSERFYNVVENPWQPKKGDYYTSTRHDNELYQIVDEDEEYFYTVYCDNDSVAPAKWKKEIFLKEWGLNRVYVAPHVLGNKS